MKRGRNQRRRPGGNNPNRALDSNGPDVRIRGTANQIYDKYIALARDASSSGDRVKAENYLQHAEHYFRVIRVNQANNPSPQQNQGAPAGEGDQPGIDETRENGEARDNSDSGERNSKPQRRNNRRPVRSSQSNNERGSSENTASDDASVEESASNADEKVAEADAEEAPKPKRRRVKRAPKAADPELETSAAE